MEKLYSCANCEHIEFVKAPAACPVCHGTSFKAADGTIMSAEKEGKEKHVPVVTATNACGLIPGDCKDVLIKVGSVPHPMQEDHWIMWIDTYLNNKFAERCILAPESLQAAAVIHFKMDAKGTVTVIEHCNKHGSWMAKAEIM
jgi:superoxide reductase